MTRRLFLKFLTGLIACFSGILSLPYRLWGNFSQLGLVTKIPASAKNKTGEKSTVVLVRDSAVRSERQVIDIAVLEKMLTRAILRLTGQSTPERAWRVLFSPDDVIGIKVNALGGKLIATHPELVKSVISGLKQAGVPEENIIVWDRLTEELKKAGYVINKSGRGVRCFGTDTNYDRNPEISGSIGSCFSKILSTYCTAVINIPVLKDHDLAGVSLGLKNFYGAIHNPNKYHDHNCNPYIADLNTHRFIKDKLRLVVCDALTLLYQGGPAFKPKYTMYFDGLLVSRDPVALDRIGCKLIEDTRREYGLPTLKDAGREPIYIATAAQRGLGIDDLIRIEFVQLLSERGHHV